MSEVPTIKILIVDDSQVVRRGIRALLELAPDLLIVGEAGDGDEALTLSTAHSPDVVLLDVQMPGRDGLSVVSTLAASARVLMLTFSDAPEVIHAAMDAGATGYVVHGTFDADTLAATVRNVADGLGVFSGPALQAIRTGPVSQFNAPADPWGLSARQVEVMEQVAGGLTNTEIARALFLSEKTVKNHINQIFAKVGAQNRGQAIVLWLGRAQ
ncbi:MAG: response regulator [Propioniciclava sp.]